MAFRLGSAAPLKRFYKYLLKRVIGSFLKRDIDLDQLEVQLWSGQVQLKNLELDVSALNVPGLRCSKAQLGCVKMLVPWRRLVSDHCKVYISGLHLTFTKADHLRQALSPAEDSNPQGFFHEAPNRTQEESRYTEEGIETLSRLVKRVLARMEVCLHDLSVTVETKPCLLRGRLSSVILLSEDGEEHMKRSLRVGVVSLSMLSAETPDEASSPHAGEVTFLSTRGQESVTAAAGVLDLGINNGVFFSSLQLPAIRLAFTEASCCMLSEAFSSLSQAVRRPALMQMPDIEDLENNPSGIEPTYEEDPQPPMVQSLLFQSAMATGPGHFWQDLYSLFQADDELASAAGDQTMAVEGENAETDPQEEEAFLDVLEGEDAKGPMVKASLKVQVGNMTLALCFLPDQQDLELWSDPSRHPQPRLLPIDALPMQRPEHQGQLCLGGLSFSLDKKLTEPEEEPFWNFSADSLGVHLHQYQEDGVEAAEEEEEAPATATVATLPASRRRSPAPEIPIGRSLAASDMFRSAFSELPPVERPRTPSLASGEDSQCVTEESEGEESESFGHSSVHSLSDAEPNEGQEAEDEGLESDEDLHDAFFHQNRLRRLLPRRAQERVAPAVGMARGQWQRSAGPVPFLSKQILSFIDSDSTGSSSGRRPPSPAPGPEHPIWITLGFQGLSQRRLWVATVAEEAKARSIRFGCFPLELDLCSASIKLLRSASRSRPKDPGEATGEAERFAGSPGSGARPGSTLELGYDRTSNVEPKRLRFVAVAPAIRMVLRLTSGTSIVGDLVLPRLLAPALPEEQDAFSEALRFDAASAMLYLSTPQEVTELLSLRRAGSAPGFVHRNALELVVLTRQAPTPVSSPKEVPIEPEPSTSPPLTGWTRLTALRPSAPPPGNLHLPPSAEPNAEPNTEPKEPMESSPDASLGGGEFIQKRCPTEVEMSVTGDVQFQIDISKICFLKQQASLFIAALTPSTSSREERRPRPEPPMRPMHPAEQSLGFTISLGRVCLRIEDSQELEDSRRQGSRVSAVQLCLTSCRCVNGSNFMAEDLRIECLVQEGSGRDPVLHTLLRPTSSPGPSQPRGSDHCAEAGEVTLSSYLWQAFPRRQTTASGCWCLEGSLRSSALTLQLRGLVFLCERPLLEQCVWLSQLQDVFKADVADAGEETEPESEVESEGRSLSVRIQLIDCFMDLPSKSSWNPSKQGETLGAKEEPLVDEKWRMVLEVTNLEGRIQTKAPHRGSLRSGRLEAYVSEGALGAVPALEQSQEMNLLGMGFVPFFEISSASCSTAKEKEAELRLGRVQCHLRPDTARTLRRVANELSALLPAPQAVDMPEVMTQKAMPKDFDLSEEAFREATSSRFDDTDNDILANVDMFAFAPPPRTSARSTPSQPVVSAPVAEPAEPLAEAMTDALQNALGGALDAPLAPELIRGSSASTTASCRVDEFIRAQELQQSPRSPVRACAPSDFEEGGPDFEMRLTDLPEALEEAVEEEEEEGSHHMARPETTEPAAESSEVVAVCILDPEVVSEQNLQKLYDQEEMARQQMEQQFLEEVGGQAAPPTPSKTKAEVRYEQDHSVLILDLSSEIIEDYFVRGELGNRRFEAPRWAPKPIAVVRLHLDEFNLSVYEGSDFVAAAWSDKDSLATDRHSRSHLTVHLGTVEAKYMQFPATLPRGVGARKLVDSSTLRCRLVLGIRDFAIQDRVHGSVFSRVLACFEDEEKKPRPSMSDMLYLRVDELVHGTSDQPDAPQEVAPEYSVELQILPLQLTVDQDTVKFAEEFWQDCCMSTYVEEPDGEDYVAQAGIVEQENEDELHADPSQALNFGGRSPKASSVPLFFQEVKVGSLFVAMDYKAKRIDTEALKRGELWQLVNALPILEGLEVRFTKVVVYQRRGLEKVLNEVAQCWGADLDRTQVLRCLSGITPIRSIANISGGFAEMVLDPLKQYLAGEDAEHVSRTMLRGVVSFLRHVTVESIDLTERVFVGAQAALEYANSRFTETPAFGSRRPSAVNLEADAGGNFGASSSSSRGAGSEWLPVERGSANFMQPGGAAEGLQEAGSNLTQGLRNTGPILVKPFVEIKQGAPKKQVLQSVVSGIPVCILRPAIGVTSAAVPAIRGVRNRLDPSHRREMVRKYRGPG